MIISIVDIYVKPEYSEDFIVATRLNVSNSNNEKGIFRFDLIRQKHDPNHFVLLEYFYNDTSQIAHRQAKHYLLWKESVAHMMEKPRESTAYEDLLIKES